MANKFEEASGRAGNSIEQNISRGAQRAALALERQTNRVADAQERVNRLRADYLKLAVSNDADDNKIIRAKERHADAERALAKAMRDRGVASRAADSALDATADGIRKVDKSARDAAGSLGQLGKNSFSFGRGGMIAGLAPIVPALIDTARVATTATQSIYLLPAAIAAAGTAFGTLKLATMGFGDAMDNIKDPEKFAESLAELSPQAQQAALSIKALLPQLKGLQAATQDSFFDGLGGEFERLSSVYLPQIEKLTTGVAGTFNQMIKNIGNQFLTPDMQANFGIIGTNITQMFQNLVPAATSLSQAFTDITAVGSSFLPGIATDISNAAQEFANFISNARDTGQLAEWIREGIDAVKLLGTAVWTLGEFVYDVFGSNGQQNISDFKDTLSGVQSVLNALTGDFGSLNDEIGADTSWTLGADIREELDKMTGFAAKFRDAIYNIPESFRALSNSAIDFANTFTDAINKGPIAAINSLIGGTTKLYNLLPGEDRDPNIGKIGDIPKIDRLPDEPYKPWNTLPSNTPGGGYSNDRYSGPTDPSVSKPKEWTDPKTGVVMVPGPAGVGGWVPKSSVPQPATPGGPRDVPAPPPTDANGKKLSDSDLQRIARENLDPSSYKVDPFANIPGMPAPGALGGLTPGGVNLSGLSLGQSLGGATGNGIVGPMSGAADPVAVYEQQHEVISKAHDLEESNKALLAAQKDGVSTAEDIQKAKWKQQEDEFALWKAQQDLVEKMRGTTKNAKSSTDQLGVALDPDLGLGQGLSGFADNITRMFGNMIARPFMEKMQAQVDADPIKGGFGLLGINGAKNIAAGTSPLFGQPYGSGGSAAAMPAYGGAGAGASFSSPQPMPGESAKAFAHRAEAPRFEAQGYTVGDHAADKYGEHQNGALDIMVPSIAEGQKVLQQVLSDPNTYGAIFNNQAYGYGQGATPRDYSGGHTGDPSQDHTNHVHAFYKPGGADNIDPNATGGPTGYGAGSAGFSTAGMGSATPVFVVNMPGGGGMGFPMGSPASGQGAGPSPGPPMGGSGFNWDAIAGAEASGNWANKSNPKYQGGLQFDPTTWATVKGPNDPANAADASREAQIAAAERLVASGATPSTQWPATYKAHPEWFQPGGAAGAAGFAGLPAGMGSATGGVDPNHPTGGGNFNPNMKIDTSTTSVAPPYDPNRVPFNDIAGIATGMGPGQQYNAFGLGGFKKSPGTDMSSLDPNSPTGAGGYSNILPGAAATGNGMGGLDPNSPVGATGAPGSIGPFPVPQSVVPGIGSAAQFGAGPLAGAGIPSPSATPTPTATPTTYGGVSAGGASPMGGTGGVGIAEGGSIDTAINLAASAFPGVGQAAATGMKLANRAIQYGGQLAGIGVSGLMETFLPNGGSELASGGWLPRIVGGLAGAKPALPNTAGQPGGQPAPPPLTPQQAVANHLGQGQGSPGPGNTVNVEYNSVGQTEDRNGADLSHHLSNLQTGGMAGKP